MKAIDKLEERKKDLMKVVWAFLFGALCQVPSLVTSIINKNYSALAAYILLIVVLCLCSYAAYHTKYDIDRQIFLLKECERMGKVINLSLEQGVRLVKAIGKAADTLLPYTHDRLHPEDEKVFLAIIDGLQAALLEDKKDDLEIQKLLKGEDNGRAGVGEAE